MNKSATEWSYLEAAIADCARECGIAMCDKCVEIDGKIEHYRRIASRMEDRAMLDGIKELIAGLQAEKAALHPGQTK
jgi:hypothetical protein